MYSIYVCSYVSMYVHMYVHMNIYAWLVRLNFMECICKSCRLGSCTFTHQLKHFLNQVISCHVFADHEDAQMAMLKMYKRIESGEFGSVYLGT